MCAVLAAAVLLTWTERRAAAQQEALIAVLSVLAASAGLLLLAGNPHAGEYLQDLLVGQILWVGPCQLVVLGVVTAVLVAATAPGWLRRLGRFGFYAAFAVAVTASVQLVGVCLVFTSLIVPGLAMLRRTDRARAFAAYLLGGTGYAAGLVLTARFDLPFGPIIVCTLVPTNPYRFGAARCFLTGSPSSNTRLRLVL